MFPPHARGWTCRRTCSSRYHRRNRFPRTRGDGPCPCGGCPGHCLGRFPRTRGDGPAQRDPVDRGDRQFPPHARGWTVRRSVAIHVDSGRAGFPRTRGDEPCAQRFRRSFPESGFPRTRGDGPCFTEGCTDAFVTVSPARAGMDRCGVVSNHRLPWRCFPRTRGDGPSLLRHETGTVGSGFPRTRGDGPADHAKA